ncbi:MAG: pirin family protein [Lentisphaeraceae bacterium]|nr:pirin family protein [Lentisphaeraceae bacterium]
MKIRLGQERGHVSHGWLEAKHSFSFGSYRDSNWDVFGKMRVLNEDKIAPNSGFPMHPHKNMEIVTIMLSGELHHKDDMGNESALKAGEVQAMSAGTGVVHSEWNPTSEETHLFQMWLFPEKEGLEPSYDQYTPEADDYQVLASNGGNGLKINANAEVIRLRLDADSEWTSSDEFQTYVHIVKGEIIIDGTELKAGDAVALDKESKTIKSLTKTELIIVKM